MRAVYDMLLAITPGSHNNLLLSFQFRNVFFCRESILFIRSLLFILKLMLDEK